MSTTALQAPSRRAPRLGHSFSPRLVLSELLLKQWFEPVIPFTVMVALAVYFSLTIPDYGTLTNALSLMRLFAEFGFVALGMAPGRIARKRGHPWAQAVAIGGWATLIFGFVFWPLILIWAFVDVPPKQRPRP